MTQQSCFIYKSLRKADAYLYVIEAGDFSAVPATLREMLGRLEYVMELQLTPERTLARADVVRVIDALSTQGYYLQMPPADAGVSALSES